MALKLSEAIRLGAMLKPQGFLSRASRPSAVATCALGAAAEAVGMSDVDVARNLFSERFPVATCTVSCPEPDGTVYHVSRCGGQTRPLKDQVWHLNDAHAWTREAIADWIESIEAQQESAAVEPAPAEAVSIRA